MGTPAWQERALQRQEFFPELEDIVDNETDRFDSGSVYKTFPGALLRRITIFFADETRLSIMKPVELDDSKLMNLPDVDRHAEIVLTIILGRLQGFTGNPVERNLILTDLCEYILSLTTTPFRRDYLEAGIHKTDRILGVPDATVEV